MPINAHPDFLAAEKEYHLAVGLENKLKALEKMISLAPKHKGAENLRAQLKARYKSLKEKIEKGKRAGKSSKAGIKKEDMQAVIVGLINSGKSSILSSLTNARPRISSEMNQSISTTSPQVGILNYSPGAQIQMIEVPAIKSDYYDKGLVHTADTIIMSIENLKQIEEINKILESKGKKIIVFNKSDLLNENEKRKITATLKSKKHDFVIFSSKNLENLGELKGKIFQSFGKIRVYTKEPGKEKTNKALVLNAESTVKEVAEKILKGFSGNVKETKIWGPSSKFPGQVVGLSHKLKDLDVVEFKTR